MFILKVLGSIDFAAGIALLMLVFGITPIPSYALFCAGLLFLKGMFIFKGEILSAVDILAAICLVLSIFISIPVFLLWILTFLLMEKAVVSFL